MKDKKEKIIFTIILFGVFFIPHTVIALFPPQNYTFTAYLGGRQDYFTFLAKMNWGYTGHWLYNNRFTTEATQAVPIYFFYIILGQLARLLHITPITMMFVANIVISGLTFWVLLRFLKHESIYAVIFAVFAFPTPLWIPDRILHALNLQNWNFIVPSFFANFFFIHYNMDILGIILILTGANGKFSFRTILKGITGSYLLLLTHPFLLLLAYAIPVCYTVIYKRRDFLKTFKYLLIIGLISLPYLAILYLNFSRVSWLIEWRQQAVETVNPLILASLIGLPFFFSLFYVIKNWNAKKDGIWIVWFGLCLLLAWFAPLPNRNEYLISFSISLGVLAGRSIEKLQKRMALSKMFLIFLVILVMLPQNVLYLFTGTFRLYNIMTAGVEQSVDPILLPNEYLQAFEVLKENGGENDGVMCRRVTGNLIPYFSGLKPFVGHFSETLNREEKEKIAEDFFAGKISSKEAENLFRKYNIRYIFVDKYFLNDKIESNSYAKIFENRFAEIYRIR